MASKALVRASHAYPALCKLTVGIIPVLPILVMRPRRQIDASPRALIVFEGTFEVLIQHGADPNQEFRGTTPWIYYLSEMCIHTLFEFPPPRRYTAQSSGFDVFLRYNGDLEATCKFLICGWDPKAWRNTWDEMYTEPVHDKVLKPFVATGFLLRGNPKVSLPVSFSAQSILGLLQRISSACGSDLIPCEDHDDSQRPEEVLQALLAQIRQEAEQDGELGWKTLRAIFLTTAT